MAVRDMLTEDEAGKCWCPLMSKFDEAHHQTVHHDEKGLVSTKANDSCIASRCMFWRWSHQDRNGIDTGFCGAAGLPKYL